MSNQANPDLPGKRTSPIPVKTLDSPFMGSPNALVTIVEFADFQCPFCKEFQPTLRKLFKDYNSKFQLVFRNYPISSIHPESLNAAVASFINNKIIFGNQPFETFKEVVDKELSKSK